MLGAVFPRPTAALAIRARHGVRWRRIRTAVGAAAQYRLPAGDTALRVAWSARRQAGSAASSC